MLPTRSGSPDWLNCRCRQWQSRNCAVPCTHFWMSKYCAVENQSSVMFNPGERFHRITSHGLHLCKVLAAATRRS